MATNDKKNTATAKTKSTEPKVRRFKKTQRFLNSGVQLIVALRQGKSGYNVSTAQKAAGERAKTGMRSMHDSQEAAVAAFEQMVAQASAKGWKPKSSGGGSSNAFTEMPAPPDAPATA